MTAIKTEQLQEYADMIKKYDSLVDYVHGGTITGCNLFNKNPLKGRERGRPAGKLYQTV